MLTDAITDARKILTYRYRKSLYRHWLALGLVAFVLGVGFAYVQPSDFGAYDWVMTVLAIVVGGLMTAYTSFRLLVPGKPAVVLSPQGIRLHLEWLKDALIPWREVRGVDSIDFTGSFRGTPVAFSGVTVVLVSQAFYDQHIHVDSWLLRGPNWHNFFIPKGVTMQVAFHHDALAASAAELRTAIETRWRVFGGAAP